MSNQLRIKRPTYESRGKMLANLGKRNAICDEKHHQLEKRRNDGIRIFNAREYDFTEEGPVSFDDKHEKVRSWLNKNISSANEVSKKKRSENAIFPKTTRMKTPSSREDTTKRKVCPKASEPEMKIREPRGECTTNEFWVGEPSRASSKNESLQLVKFLQSTPKKHITNDSGNSNLEYQRNNLATPVKSPDLSYMLIEENSIDKIYTELVPVKKLTEIQNIVPNNHSDSDNVILCDQYSCVQSDKENTTVKGVKSSAVLEKKGTTMGNSQNEKRKHVLPPCQCKRKCYSYFSEIDRENINSTFWASSKAEKIDFIRHSSMKTLPKRRRPRVDIGSAEIKKSCSIKYFLSLEETTEPIQICQKFFLATLGFSEKNNRFVLKAVKSNPSRTKDDNRGKYVRENSKRLTELIIEHILSYNPSISHYRREHAPRMRYLSNEISIKEMHRSFLILNSLQSKDVSYEKYRTVLRKERISFTKLGHELCEKCTEFDLHNKLHSKKNLQPDCSICVEWGLHHKRYVEARILYKEHATLAGNTSDTIYYSADLQKVLMLPRMEQFKQAIFTRRLVVFHESFVPLGKQSSHKVGQNPFSTIWHEGIAGRKKQELISCFHNFFCEFKVENIILWLDNCAGQNKNWAFFSYLAYMVNDENIPCKSIEINYFEPGHSFMSADSFHHQVEEKMKKMNFVYNLYDFTKCVSQARKGTLVKLMEPGDFKFWKDYSSSSFLQKRSRNDIPLLKNLMRVKFHAGSYSLMYTTASNNNNFKEMNFMKPETVICGIIQPPSYTNYRGVEAKKKRNIISKLLPLMPPNKKQFWKSLEESFNVPDLLTSDDEEEVTLN